MPKIQYFKLDIADWTADTRILSLAARGAWLEILLNMTSRKSDRLEGSMEQIAGVIGCPAETLSEILSELAQNSIAEISVSETDVSILCRRLSREKAAMEKAKPGKPIFFDYAGDAKIHGITRELLAQWKELFPAIDVPLELKAASAWLDANRKNRKTDLKRFLVNWLNKSQDHARRVSQDNTRFINREKSDNEDWEI